MYIVIAVILIVCSWSWLIKKQQEIVPLHEEVIRCESMVNKEQTDFQNKFTMVINTADKALKEEGKTLTGILETEKINLSDLRYVGSLYPDIQYRINDSLALAERTYAGYSHALTELGKAIQKYNTCVKMMPTCIAAWVFGYDPETPVDANNLKDSKVLYRAGTVQFNNVTF